VIPADRITFNGNEAWWVVKPVHRRAVTNTVGDDYDDPSWFMSLDRPCETCDETSYVQGEEFVRCGCIDGRHTFDIETPCPTCATKSEWCGFDGIGNPDCSNGTATYRAAIIEVLPITEGLQCSERIAHVCQNPEWSHTGWLHHAELTDDRHIETEWPIILPPAAAPGMYAVRLKLSERIPT
jgi:hypothetical protein